MIKVLISPCYLLWKHRQILWQTTRSDIKARFAGSVLGFSWLLLYPLFLLGAYAAIYIYVFKLRFALFNSNEYVAFIFCGLIPFLGFAEALGSGVPSVTSNANLIKNTLFPIELIPVKAVLGGQCTQVVGMGLLLTAIALLDKLSWWVLLLPLVWLLQMMFMLGVIWILSSMNVYLRDLQNIVTILILILMMTSPIAYTADMIPSQLRVVLGLNPLYYIIVAYQDCLMLGQFPRNGVFWILLGIGAGSFWLRYWFFTRMKKVFVDNV